MLSTASMSSRGIAKRVADITLAALVVLVVGMMIVPLPTVVLDVLIATNISAAVLVMLVATYIASGLQLSAFPTLLLITTLYRLALNVSSTRLILLQADAGDVIAAFGDFVVQGNYVVGGVVFLILTLIQFLVIAKGAERVAEVGARFTLDAMPGKQMSIDAELRAGAITQEEARQKRSELGRESQFYGAMDGAMKFVKGDAIAGIVITIVNILGGLAIGVAMRDMSAGEALQTYGLLTIGDGLVSQIPALLISTAAGLVVTRVASEHDGGSLGSDVAQQIFGNPKPLRIAAVFLLILAIIPGLPALPFLLLSALLFGAALALGRSLERAAEPTIVAKEEAARETKARRAMVPLLVPVSIEVGEALTQSVTDEHGAGPLLEEEIPALRDQLFVELGVALPAVRARAVSGLGNRFAIALQEVPALSAEIPPEKSLALESPSILSSLAIDAEPATDPFGGPAAWIDSADAGLANAESIPVLGPPQIVARHLGAVVRRRAGQLVGIQEVQTMLDQLERAYPALVRAVVPKPVSLALLADILRRLVEEQVSIRPLREILETLAVHAPNERDPLTLTELVRAGLRRSITHRRSVDGVLAAFTLDSLIEEAVREAIQRSAAGSYLALPPDMARDIISAVQRETEGAPAPVVLTQADVRRFVRKLVEIDVPQAVILSYQELAPEATVQPLGRIAI